MGEVPITQLVGVVTAVEAEGDMTVRQVVVVVATAAERDTVVVDAVEQSPGRVQDTREGDRDCETPCNATPLAGDTRAGGM